MGAPSLSWIRPPPHLQQGVPQPAPPQPPRCTGSAHPCGPTPAPHTTARPSPCLHYDVAAVQPTPAPLGCSPPPPPPRPPPPPPPPPSLPPAPHPWALRPWSPPAPHTIALHLLR